ncbi:MAG: DUF72 domain-containing protein [Flavobacteriales bacterium]|nr:DUF72 domain-containing protein [Flavobacteriales bacterium]
MKYGKIPEEEQQELLPGVDFSLPEDHPETARGLAPGKGRPLEVRAGGTMWTIRAWRGSVYPQKAPQRTWPTHYGQSFGTIELNATHYRIHPPERMAEWAAAMPDDFRFCPKFPAIITHYRRFNDCAGPTDDFIAGLDALGSKRGPAFIQLPPHFSPKHADRLMAYLQTWPRSFEAAVEFRHPGWFAPDPEFAQAVESVWEAMREWGIGAVISDTALRRDAVHMRMTAPFLLLRFGGYEGHPSDEWRLKEWCRRIQAWHAEGLQSVDLLVHQPDSIRTPETCRMFSELAKSQLGAELRVPAPALF